MKKCILVISIFFYFIIGTITVYAATNKKNDASVENKANEAYKTAVDFANTHLENYKRIEKMDEAKMHAGEGMQIAYLPNINQDCFGKKVSELAMMANEWLYTADTQTEQLVFFTIKKENEEAKLVFYGGYAFYYGKIRDLAREYAEQNEMIMDENVYCVTNQYFFMLTDKNGNEYMVPTSEQYYMSDAGIQVVGSEDFIKKIINDSINTVEGERGYTLLFDDCSVFLLNKGNKTVLLYILLFFAAIIFMAGIICLTGRRRQ